MCSCVCVCTSVTLQQWAGLRLGSALNLTYIPRVTRHIALAQPGGAGRSRARRSSLTLAGYDRQKMGEHLGAPRPSPIRFGGKMAGMPSTPHFNPPKPSPAD